MTHFMVFTTRNLKLYLRDKGAVFFSLLSMIIIIGLMTFFLGDMSVNGITSVLQSFPDRDVTMDATNALLTVLSWTSAGILSINAVTVTLASYSIMIKDRVEGKLGSIYTAPISRITIAASYVASAWACSMFMCTLTLIFAEGICCAKGMTAFDLPTQLKLLGLIAVNSFTFSAIMYVLALLSKTVGAWSGIGTVIGTLVGFLGAIYVPIGSLSGTIVAIIKCTPIIYGTALFRSIMTDSIVEQTFAGLPPEVAEEFRKSMGIDLYIGSHAVTPAEELCLLLISGMIFLSLGIVILKYSKKTDR